MVFDRSDLDLWVLEVGLGGRLDAVNLVDCDVAVVTTVDLDHQDFLGTDRDLIGREKAGVFRSDKPAVLGSSSLPDSVADQARRLACPLDAFNQHHGSDDRMIWWAGGHIERSRLTTTVPPANLATAVQAFRRLGYELTPDSVLDALNRIQLVGRLQRVTARGCDWVLDVGHNPHAAAHLAGTLAPVRHHVVLAMLADKDVAGVAKALEPIAASWHLAPLGGPRGLDAPSLRDRATVGRGQCYDSVAAAMHGAESRAEADHRPILVCGSFFTVSHALDALTIDRTESVE